MALRLSQGQLFEEVFLDHFASMYGRDFRPSTQTEDRLLGTDGFLFGVPIDFTLDFRRKDHLFYLGQVDVQGVYSISVGVRWRNRHRVFPQPVLVLGFTFYGDCHECRLLAELVDKASLEAAFDLYWEWVDAYENGEVALA